MTAEQISLLTRADDLLRAAESAATGSQMAAIRHARRLIIEAVSAPASRRIAA